MPIIPPIIMQGLHMHGNQGMHWQGLGVVVAGTVVTSKSVVVVGTVVVSSSADIIFD